jgi:hypothetical protein
MYRLFISEAVVEEASRGDVEASRRRLEALRGLEELAIDEPAIGLAEKLLENGLIPQKAAADAPPRGCGRGRFGRAQSKFAPPTIAGQVLFCGSFLLAADYGIFLRVFLNISTDDRWDHFKAFWVMASTAL